MIVSTRFASLALALCAAAASCAERAAPATFYVDSEKGSDTASGTDATAAWKTLAKVNAAALIPGDRVLFKRGGLWRGQLVPKSGSSGARILYGAYGDGAKPILQGSAARDKGDEWSEIRPGLWATQKFEPRLLGQSADLRGAAWIAHNERGAAVRLERMQEEGAAFTRVTCEAAGKASNHIQLWGPTVSRLEPCMALRLRARSTIPFTLNAVRAIRNRAPYLTALAGDTRINIGADWQTFDVILMMQQTVEAPRLHMNLGDTLPAGAVFDFEALGLWEASVEHCTPILFDVGILILNHGEQWGVKKWSQEDVKAPLDYWYDPESKRVLVACDENPAVKFKSVELALTKSIISQGNCHDLIYDGLALRYGAAHGFGGGNTQRITIRNCDLSWIGGGLQYWKTRADGSRYPVRYGNAIEFWGAASDHLVERNRIWEVYDAALTNQGNSDDSHQINITYRDNVIWNSEYSFEFWNRPESAITSNIVFEFNTCVDAGICWSHAQRPNPNGAHLMLYPNPSQTSAFIVRNNIFCRSSDRCIRRWNTWTSRLAMSNNLYWSPDKPIMRWQEKTDYEQGDFARYQSELGLDQGSLVAEPQFVNPAGRDYRLKPGSPGSTLATDGGPVGARAQ
ncbi:MAG TPA: hypothetical protein PLW27_04150 [Kiritimatiellia bacterium]|nr:hypothetical protein [Kiritimatiellia bacterium]